MEVTIQTVNFKESKRLNDLIHEKVSKLFKQSETLIRVDVLLKKGAAKNSDNKWCKIYISKPGDNKFVKKNSDAYEKSIHLAIEAMRKILRRSKL